MASSDPLATPYMRALSLADQAFFSAANFVATIAFARFFPSADLACYGIGMSIAVILQSAQRNTLVVPMVLLEEWRFRRRRGGLIGQNLTLLAIVLGVGAATMILAFALGQERIALAAASMMSCTMIYFPVDFDRALLLRSGFRQAPFAMSLTYFSAICVLAVLSFFHAISFPVFLLGQGLFGVAKTFSAIAMTARPRMRHSWILLAHSLKNNFGWASSGTLISTGFINIPLFVLGIGGNALAIAAYVATRSPLQPLMVVIRSLDIVDKLQFARDADSATANPKHTFYSALARYFAGSALFAIVTGLGAKYIILFFLGPKYLGFEFTLFLWALVFVFIGCMLPIETIVYREGRVKTYAFIQFAGSVAALLSAVPLSYYFGASGAVGACLVAWGLVFLATWLSIVRPIVNAYER